MQRTQKKSDAETGDLRKKRKQGQRPFNRGTRKGWSWPSRGEVRYHRDKLTHENGRGTGEGVRNLS